MKIKVSTAILLGSLGVKFQDFISILLVFNVTRHQRHTEAMPVGPV